ncbi:uncharacterized protein LOC123523663 [Mercenaria mercenaria]|uniref:uncharacterized protein LOC123523663 n=1 Tax=Mercenaria mercenaria TaxID=6596 RepID=UPI00234F955B|nr:uncharacterized protein LOC123523663 [Mercenaria mercenaria]
MEGTQQNQHENQHKSAAQIKGVKEISRKSPREDEDKKGNKKNRKPRKRKRSAKQIERWNRYRENKYLNYVHGAYNGQLDQAQSASYLMPYVNPLIRPVIRPADLPLSRSVLQYADTRDERHVKDAQVLQNGPGALQYSGSVLAVDDVVSKTIMLPREQQFADTFVSGMLPDPKAPEIVSELRADAKIFVPRSTERLQEQRVPYIIARALELAGNFRAAEEIRAVTDHYNFDDDADVDITVHDVTDDDIFGIMSVYADSGLNNKCDEMACSNTMQEDFGYVYFSIQNL